jgi:CPA2 family monovalent cation:H+ antiporter-2
MYIPILRDIVIIIGLAVLVTLACHRFKIPSLIGYLLTGILAGPHGLSLIQAEKEVEIMAEIGIILLLFSIGLEFSFKRLNTIKRQVLLGGSFQVGLSAVAAFGLAVWMGRELTESVFIGFLVALSSTAIVLKELQSRSALFKPFGQNTVAVLLFQDLIVLPMMILAPLMAGQGRFQMGSVAEFLIEFIALIAVIGISARWLIPVLLYRVARTRNSELFLMTIIFAVFSIAWLTSQIGLSLALGAFVVGLIISESEYSHHTVSMILPFRDIFMSFFFVSVGMLLDPLALSQNIPTVLILLLVVWVLKASIAGLAALVLGYALPVALAVAFSLAQIGEFSFILSRVGLKHGLISADDYQIFLSVAVLSMMVTPLLMTLGQRLAGKTKGLPFASGSYRALQPDSIPDDLTNHLLIIGYGLNGQNVSRAARAAQIPYAIIEANPDTVMTLREKGEHIFYGDATYKTVLEAAGTQHARVLVVTLADPAATRQVVAQTRSLNAGIYIIARTRFIREIKPLRQLGANEVIPEEFETAVEIFTRVLYKYMVPRQKIDLLSAEVRAHGYELFTEDGIESFEIKDLGLGEMEIETVEVQTGSRLVNQTLYESQLRQRYQVNVLAIYRQDNLIMNPHGENHIQLQDRLIVVGTCDAIARFVEEMTFPSSEHQAERS